MGTNEKGALSNGLSIDICLDFFFISGAVLFQGVGSLNEPYQYMYFLQLNSKLVFC